jgi:hypothetical protein
MDTEIVMHILPLVIAPFCGFIIGWWIITRYKSGAHMAIALSVIFAVHVVSQIVLNYITMANWTIDQYLDRAYATIRLIGAAALFYVGAMIAYLTKKSA